MPDEGNLSYEGWRVAGAAALGVFVSFASLLRLHLRHLPEAAGRGVRLVARSRVRGVRLRRDDRRRVLAAARHAARPLRAAADHRAVPGDLRRRVRLAVAAHAASVAPLRGIRRDRHRRQRHGADGVHARRVELVRDTPRRGPGADAVGRRRRRDGAAADRAGADRPRRAGGPRVRCSAGWCSSWGCLACSLRPRASGTRERHRPRPRRRHGARGLASRCVLDSRRGPLLQLDCAERRHHAPVGDAHGPRCRRGGGGRGRLGDGRCRSRRPARSPDGCSIASSRRASRSRCSRGGPRHLAPVVGAHRCRWAWPAPRSSASGWAAKPT